MLNRIYLLIKGLIEYIVKGTITISNDKATFHIDTEGNLFIVHKNLIVNTEGFRLIDCETSLVAKVLNYSKQGREEEAESVIKEKAKVELEDQLAKQRKGVPK